MDLLMLPKLLVLMNLVLPLLRLDKPSSLWLLVPALPLPLKLNSLSFWMGFSSRSEERLYSHIYNEYPYGLSPCRHVGWWHDMNGRMILSETTTLWLVNELNLSKLLRRLVWLSSTSSFACNLSLFIPSLVIEFNFPLLSLQSEVSSSTSLSMVPSEED